MEASESPKDGEHGKPTEDDKEVIHFSASNGKNVSSYSESHVVVSQCQWPSISTLNITNSIESSICNSPSLYSPPSSAFVSALQSPYISPRATQPQPTSTPPSPLPSLPQVSIPASCCSGSYSDDIPSTSYTPPTEDRFDFSDDPTSADQKHLKYVTCETAVPRISFSFSVPRISLTKSTFSPSCNAKLRSCDVYIGFHGQQNHNLARFCKWLKSELEVQGIACFVADRSKYSDTQSHEIADRIICSAAIGVVVVTDSSFLNHFSMEEIVFFTQKKNLIPLLFDIDSVEVADLLAHNCDDKESRDAIHGLLKWHEFKLEANESNWRSCVLRVVGILKTKLGRKSASSIDMHDIEELPYPINKSFAGREKEILEIENSFFGCNDSNEHNCSKTVVKEGSDGLSEGFADEESDVVRTRGGGRYINLEMRKYKETTLEARVEPVIGKSPSKRSKHKKTKSINNRSLNSVVCINGPSGIGKTELAIEFAYRYSQRYKMVLWVGGEARYFRQNILNLSLDLGLDVGAEVEKERGRIRSFEEQEYEAFHRVKRELFRDVPYLLIIDNLETEKEWWEGKDLFDLIPRNTGATNVIITTRLPKVMNFEAMQLPPLPPNDVMILIKGRQKDYPSEELEFLKKFDERLRRSSFGNWIVGSLLSELSISPRFLFEAVNKVCLEDDTSCLPLSAADEHFFKNNNYLMNIMEFCYSVLQDTSSRRNSLAARMLLAGAWFASAPISVNLLAAAAKNIPSTKNRFKEWSKSLSLNYCCFSGCSSQIRKSEVDSALLLVKLGLAKRTSRQPGCWIQFHPITQIFAKIKGGLQAAQAAVQGVRWIGNPAVNSDHLWASTFLIFGFKCEAPLVQLKAVDMALFVKRTALPLAIYSFTTFSRCISALELLKVCTNVLEDVEKAFVSPIQDLHYSSLCWKKNLQSNRKVDEFEWEDVTLLKATLLETRAKLLLRGGHFDSGEELCRTCISIRTVVLGHNHAQTLAAQETLTKLVRYRSKM